MKKNKKNLLCSLSIEEISNKNINENLKDFKTSFDGLSFEEVENRRAIYGENVLEKRKKFLLLELVSIIFSPFNLILLFIIFFYLFNIYISQEKENIEYSTIYFISFFLFISSIINLTQILKFSKVSEKLQKKIQIKTIVKRKSCILEIPLSEIVVGDIVFLSVGNIIPADIKIFESNDFFVKETALTGESEPVKKDALSLENYKNILEDKKIVFMGTNVISGYAKGIVIAIGDETYLGKINKILIKKKPTSNLEKKISSISKILTLCIFFIFPLICFISFIKNPSCFNLLESFLFALTMTLGITPEMLPLIVTTSFLTGIYSLSKKNVIVKNLYSMQDFGFMNILFSDKTGTLTEDKIHVENYLDLENKKNFIVLEYAFYNNYFQSSIQNSIKFAIIQESQNKIKEKTKLEFLEKKFNKINETPFNFRDRKLSVFLENKKNKSFIIITQGSIEEILEICDYYILPENDDFLFNEKKIPIDKKKILKITEYYNEQGFRVIGLAYKKIDNINDNDNLNIKNKMIMIGFLTFLDYPKKSSSQAISLLKKYNVNVKMLTGDNPILSKFIASKINLCNSKECLLGTEIDKMTDHHLYQKALQINIFAKLNPNQKERIVSLFRKKGNIVGYIGDGINDTPAMKSANFAIAVDSSVDIAKETADILFLKEDLKVIQNGIIEGRKTYINMLKYINLTLASNFGNVFSILVTLYFLPFLPFLPIQILFLNLIYDISCLVIPFDNVDEKYLQKPSTWKLKNITDFMFLFGFISFLFDMLFFYLIYKKGMEARDFQIKWFIFSIWTQIINIFILRTENIIKDNKISFNLLLFLILNGIFSLSLPFIEFMKKFLKFGNNPFLEYQYFLIFFILLVLYISTISIAKKFFISKKKKLF
ncbi:MAG: magnesium-translocating P-type ATPase [Candidatus Phytoplasma stylosanthis]|uniref:magnesium-translocating P-type ATPase n=1 Tax=Candidatus Phytoplasma stylosanthis TaxID=2798314 RepID=UPI00293B38EE|nr:magnesium-translocating P-type ATPase [Candidatus Phytoplasma stylosanthis]MDV3168034.1 magnesium-translocating P-type ATPase [Candidatus Phytoplasma stylosanthis]MDV3170798.1 magnesium-translocating P-type ATPase [Candidatus Phytoplasma stylosanthis]MDV3173606.1 magnesium-translocating P-type ATPase [Candidatus Phytoplasma stylosanthis]MDV3174188.1 magnesium-translocating P-type ATPase [Candidatus Phytoplasma stylosanthis]MDV3202521.1 magnesium-translocating P-type ATPase [Candidatus Phyto